MTDGKDELVTRLRALADLHYPAKLTVALREAADALEAEETRRMMLNTSNGEWSKRFHALEQERDAVKSKLVEAEKVNSAMDMIKSSIESGTLLDAITRAKQERDAARAEAADFRELLKEMRDLADKDGYLSRILSVKVIDQALSQPGPGAALLDEMQRLRALKEAVLEEEAAIDACDRGESGAVKRHVLAHDALKAALAALEAPT